jgi:hypothetical protein
MYNPAGAPFNPGGAAGFSYHAVGSSLDADGTTTNVFDVSVRCPLETSSGSCLNTQTPCPVLGMNLEDLSLASYLPLVCGCPLG